jgi:choline dehydrogenase
VGENFRDHYAARFVMRAKGTTRTLNTMARGLPLAGQILRWGTGQPSVLATGARRMCTCSGRASRGWTSRTCNASSRPAPTRRARSTCWTTIPGVTAGAWQHRPESKGWVRARSADVFDDPEMQPNYLSDPMDVRVHLGGMRLLRRMLSTPR